jgi:hypothetical protein
MNTVATKFGFSKSGHEGDWAPCGLPQIVDISLVNYFFKNIELYKYLRAAAL